MKTIIRNGKKHIVTDSLYHSIKKSKLNEWINPFAGSNNSLASNPQTGNTNQDNTSEQKNNEQNNAIVQEFNSKYGNKIINNLQNFINAVKELKANASNEDSEVSKKALYDNNKFAVIANIILNACKSDFNDAAWVSNLIKYSKNYNMNPDELLIMNMKEDAVDVARSKGFITRRDDENANKIKQYFVDIIKDGKFDKELLASRASERNLSIRPAVAKEYNELKKIILTKAEEENKNLSVNKDKDPSNDINLVDSINGILNKENEDKIVKNAVDKIINTPNYYSKIKSAEDLSKVSQKLIKKDTVKLIRNTSNDVENGKTEIKNPNADKDDVVTGLNKILSKLGNIENYTSRKNEEEIKAINKDNFKKAVEYVDNQCDIHGDDDEKIEDYCGQASEQFKVNKDKLLKFILKYKNENSNMKKLNYSVKNVRDYNEVLDSSLEYKNPMASPIIDIINYFYEEMPKNNNDISEAAGTVSKNEENTYIQQLTMAANEYHSKQMEIVNNIKKVRKNVNNPIIISKLVDELSNKKGIPDSGVIDDIIRNATDTKSLPDNKIIIDYDKIENAKNNVEQYITYNSEKSMNLDNLYDDNDDTYYSKFNKVFNNGVFDSLLKSYEMVGKAVVIGCFLDNASNYASKKPNTDKDKDGNNKLTNVLRAFRKHMGRNINYEDEELYNDTQLQCEAAIENSKVFLKDAKALFRELYPFPVPFFTKKKKLGKDQMKAFESSDDKDKIKLYDQILAYDAITKYYNTLSEEQKTELSKNNDTENNDKDYSQMFEKLIVKTVPDNKSKQINKDVVDELNFEFQAFEYQQLNNFYTELSNDTRITNNYKIRQIYKQKAFEQHDRFLIVFTKNGNFICTLKLVKILGKTRNVLDNLSKSDSPKYKVDRMFNKIKNFTKFN